MKTIFSLIAVLFIASNLQAQDTPKVATDTFMVKGVCGMCEERIENAAYIKGVKFCDWDKVKQQIVVIYNTDKVSIDDIHKSIAAAGYKTEKVVADAKAYSELPACCAYNSVAPH